MARKYEWEIEDDENEPVTNYHRLLDPDRLWLRIWLRIANRLDQQKENEAND